MINHSRLRGQPLAIIILIFSNLPNPLPFLCRSCVSVREVSGEYWELTQTIEQQVDDRGKSASKP
jgi:hypothetical protein